MSYKLKSRQTQVPNGYKFTQPETGWSSSKFASFTTIVNALINHRKGRPDLIAKHGWATDVESVSNEVEAFNVNLCLRHGWMDYLVGGSLEGGALPKPKAPSQEEVAQLSAAAGRAKKIWAGIKTLSEWIYSDQPPVVQELANQRALVCAKCPQNKLGGFESWFTAPAAGAIKRQIERLQERKLSTPSDAELNLCNICLCPLKLKVHTPIGIVKSHIGDAVFNELQAVSGCWVAAEIESK